jgi:hypothetical protein
MGEFVMRELVSEGKYHSLETLKWRRPYVSVIPGEGRTWYFLAFEQE